MMQSLPVFPSNLASSLLPIWRLTHENHGVNNVNNAVISFNIGC